MCHAGEPDTLKVPHLPDETSLVKLKAHPEQYVGKTFVICGGLKISDYYNCGYGNAKETHYCLDFSPVGATMDDLLPGSLNLYLQKGRGNAIIESQTKSEESMPKGVTYRLARVKVTLLPDKYNYLDMKQLDLEVIDVQFSEKDKSGWQPWMIESEVAKGKEAAAKNTEIIRKAAEERKKAESAKKAAAEAARWRTWTDSSGEHKIEAKFAYVIKGSVKLVKKDGSTITIPLEKLSDEDQAWIKNRKR